MKTIRPLLSADFNRQKRHRHTADGQTRWPQESIGTPTRPAPQTGENARNNNFIVKRGDSESDCFIFCTRRRRRNLQTPPEPSSIPHCLPVWDHIAVSCLLSLGILRSHSSSSCARGRVAVISVSHHISSPPTDVSHNTTRIGTNKHSNWWSPSIDDISNLCAHHRVIREFINQSMCSIIPRLDIWISTTTATTFNIATWGQMRGRQASTVM